MPRIAFMFAPSRYSIAPASWIILAISTMCASNFPTVFGLVTITAATSSLRWALRSSRSVRPSGRDLMLITPAPHIAQLAGFVPWAVSGARTIRRLGWP